MLDTWVPLTPSLDSPMCPICPHWKQIPENAGSTLGKAGGNPGNINSIPTLIGLGFCSLGAWCPRDCFPPLSFSLLLFSPALSILFSPLESSARSSSNSSTTTQPSSKQSIIFNSFFLRMPLPPSLFRAPSLPGYPVQWA